MADDGDTKDDVKVPDGEVGEKIEKLFRGEEKDLSASPRLYPANASNNSSLDTDVIVLTSMGEEVAIEAKEAPQKS